MKIIVIGAGLGGLAASCLMARKGHEVTVYEKNGRPGGKMNLLETQGFRFDTGPSLLTLPFIPEKLFAACGSTLDDYLEFVPLDPLCRYFYKDGTRFDSYQSVEKNLDQLAQFAAEDRESFGRFLSYSKQLYTRTKDAFLFNPLYSLSDLASLNPLDFLRIDAFTSVSDRVDSYFRSPYMRQFFKRFATYNGSSPFQAPATLNVIPHAELTMGGYYVKGGMYQVVQALVRLARQKGVQFHHNTEIKRIDVAGRRVSGVVTAEGSSVAADVIIANSDATETYLNLLPKEVSGRKQHAIRSQEPSCSGFVLMLGMNRKYEQLLHHNIFFSADYKEEFDRIFRQKVMPGAPTIYVADTSYSDPLHAPENGSNLFVLVNAPYLSDSWRWEEKATDYGDFIIGELERRGLANLRNHIIVRRSVTPADFYERYKSNRGSIYGTSSNNRYAAFVRPRNKSREIDGLYLVGGSTHPGGGIPLVILSAIHACELFERYN